jgi:Zn-dependent protease with chaperone function
MKRRFIALGIVATLLVGSAMLVSLSKTEYRVDFTSVVELWADVFKDTNKVGLTITRVSDQKEMEFGAQLTKPLDALVTSDPKLQKYVAEIGQRLVKQVRRKGIEYRFHVVGKFGINAFALPGGNIYITESMLQVASSEAEVAAILAHEISHVDLRHCIERFQYELLARRILPSDVAAISRLPYSLLTVAYSKQEEQEADINGVMIMAQAGYHPKYALVLGARYWNAVEEGRHPLPGAITQELGAAIGEALKDYFQTHPSWPDRVRALASVLRRNEAQWRDQRFYVGRVNHTERISWATEAIGREWRAYDEPPAFLKYVTKDAYPHFKAMAVHVPSGLSGIASDEPTPIAAIEHAVSYCEMKIKPCRLYALGDSVVLNLSPLQLDSITSEYSKTGGIERDYRSYLRQRDFKAFAIDPSSGRTTSEVGHEDVQSAIQQAIGRCSETGQTCELYAVGDVVVQGMPKDQADAAIEQYRQKVSAVRIAEPYLEHRSYKDFKALAVDYQSDRVAVSQAQPTPSKAIEQAIAACSGDVLCEVHAIGDTIVRGKTNDERNAIASTYARQVIERISGGQFQQYLSKKDFKVFVADVPRGYWHYQTDHWHPLAALNSTLKKCRESGNNCEVVALGDRFVLDDPTVSLAAILDQYNMNWPVGVPNPVREYMTEDKFTDFKAFAGDSHYWYRTWGRPSVSAAIYAAVAQCRTKNPSCELYAVGNHVVFGQPDAEKKATMATYVREVLLKKLEFFKQPQYTNFKAIAGNPDSMLFSMSYGRESAAEAMQEAMRTCTEQYKSCQVFAVGDTIVFGLPQEQIDGIVNEYQQTVGASRQMSN